MNPVLRRWSILAWPIWAKLLAGLLLASFVPLLVVGLLASDSFQAVAEQNVRLFLAETGERQSSTISSVFRQARADIAAFIEDENNFNVLRRVLPVNADVDVNPIDRASLVTEVQAQLLNRPATVYSEISIVNPEGGLVARVLPGNVVSIISGADLSSTTAFQRAIEAQLMGETQVLSIAADEAHRPLVDVVNVLSVTVPGVPQPVVLGYVLAQVNPQAIQLDTSAANTSFLSSTTRLFTLGGYVADTEGMQLASAADIDRGLLASAASGETHFDTVTQDGIAFTRYYTVVEDSPFVLVISGRTDAVVNQLARFALDRGFPVVIGFLFLLVVLAVLGNQLLVPPLRRLNQAIQGMSVGNYAVPVPDVWRGDELGEVAGSFADMRRQLVSLIVDLEQRMEARTRDVAATREIGQVVATQRDVQQLMDAVVNLIVARFENIYHAQIFLIDNDRNYAVLRASTGTAGRRLLEFGHRLAVGSVSVIGRVTEMGETVVARDTSTSQVHRRNEFLPDTLAELAIPLRVGDHIIGALDVQSRQNDTFDDEQINVLQTMANQVAIAIENARLYTESRRRMSELEYNRRTTTLQAWHEYMRSQRQTRLESVAGAQPQADHLAALRQSALEQGQVVVGERTERRTIPLAVPIRLRGQLLGTVEWEVPEADFNRNKVQLAQNLTDQLAINLENARLFQASQRTTERERLVNEISARLTTQNDIDRILQAAVREVGQALRTPQVSIRLNANGHTDTQEKAQ
jgi:GAF domain-containing protein/HAMP domain-containing protein